MKRNDVVMYKDFKVIINDIFVDDETKEVYTTVEPVDFKSIEREILLSNLTIL